ncbi:Succinyl-diaminopimelate desuccinylase [Pseudoclavibacter triregionum]|nr:Succinyl-diaminopimelate desuccinylase [Pseudoclavibacter triregionum]
MTAADDRSADRTDRTPSDDLEAALRDRVELGMPHVIARLGDLVRIPSVSWDAFDPANVRASAEATKGLLEATGLFERVEIHQHEDAEGRLGQPGVVAVRPAAPGFPTVTLYAHHDVQPEGDHELWRTPPFEPSVVGERLYGRGASDDKAGVIAHIGALEALRDVLGEDLRLGVTVFVEGEEENGSRSFAPFLAAHRDDLRGDVIIVADSDNPSVEQPGLTVALRGNITMDVTVRTMEHAWHSGMFGGAVPDAMLATIRLLDSLWDERGRVAVEGLISHDGETAARDEEEFRRAAELLEGVELLGDGPIDGRIWFKPAITVTGIDAPSVANASNTLSPAITVHLSCRIAPGQDPKEAAEALTRHLEAHAPFGAHLSFANLDTGAPFLVDVSGPAAQLMLGAMRDGWDAEPAQTGVGGSIPFIADFVREFPEAEILVTGVEDPQTMAHSPNESQHLGVLRRAILAEALFLARYQHAAERGRAGERE